MVHCIISGCPDPMKLTFDFDLLAHSTVAFRLGEVQDPRAKLFMILYGRKGESGKISLAPSDDKKFEPGRLYTVSANIRDIGPVR